jgi:hypothetical protein
MVPSQQRSAFALKADWFRTLAQVAAKNEAAAASRAAAKDELSDLPSGMKNDGCEPLSVQATADGNRPLRRWITARWQGKRTNHQVG